VPEDHSFDDVLAANADFAATFRDNGLPAQAARGLAVVTCIDSRISPLELLGLQAGDAAIFRNAGARVTDSVLNSLVLSRYLIGVERTMVIAHTDCRVAAASEDELHTAIERAGGARTRDLSFPVTTDQQSALDEDVERIRSSPHLAGLPVAGFVYDVRTGSLDRRA
jgi:carbonic anhydrase